MRTARALPGVVLFMLLSHAQLHAQGAPQAKAGVDELVKAGRREFQKWSPRGAANAGDYARRAITADSNYAPAWALLAESQVTSDPAGAKVAATRAVRLDSSVALTWTVLGRAQQATREFRGAETSYQRAIALDSSAGDSYGWYASLLAAVGRYEEALPVSRKAAALDRGWADAAYPALLGLGRYEEVVTVGRAGIAADSIDPLFTHNLYLGFALLERNQPAEAIRLVARHRTIRELPPWNDAWVYARGGQTVQARAVLADLTRLPNTTQGQKVAAAGLYANLSQPDSAFMWLDKAYGPTGMTNLRWHPQWKPIRGDPRFAALMRKLSLST
jgi:tetratricopeptide (TPR) repeat protein